VYGIDIGIACLVSGFGGETAVLGCLLKVVLLDACESNFFDACESSFFDACESSFFLMLVKAVFYY